MGNFFERDYLNGEDLVYPGHPVVIAYLIMRRFESYVEATEKNEGAMYNRALSSADIPGGGGEVNMALDILKACIVDKREPSAVADEYSKYWLDYKAGGHLKSVDSGNKQYLHIREMFLDKIKYWPHKAKELEVL